MVVKVNDPVVFADVEVPGVAGRVAPVRGILHRNQFGSAATLGQVKHALMNHSGAGIPVGVKGEQNPVIIVDEPGSTWIFTLSGWVPSWKRM